MANDKGQHIDTTYLTIDQTITRGYMHRDYQAHCVKYSELVMFIRRQKYWREPWILDVGCGKESPLCKPLSMRQNIRPDDVGCYIGVDYGKIDRKWLSESSTFPAHFFPETDFAEVQWPISEYQFEMIVSLEMMEHVEPEHAFRILQKMYMYLVNDGRLFLSTPVYNGKAALNHVNEMTFFGFETLVELAGFEIEDVHGTFSSQSDYKHVLCPEALWTYNVLKDRFEPEVLSMIMGQLAPADKARNCMWRCTKSSEPITLDAATWDYLADPKHGSSDQWTSFIESIRPKKRPRQLRGG